MRIIRQSPVSGVFSEIGPGAGVNKKHRRGETRLKQARDGIMLVGNEEHRVVGPLEKSSTCAVDRAEGGMGDRQRYPSSSNHLGTAAAGLWWLIC